MPDTTGHALEDRLGQSRASAEDEAYAAALATLHDPVETLTRRGLLDGETLDEGLAGALGLLATPTVAVDLDVVVERVRARAWHREADGAVATLATVDGIVFELAWFPATAWAAELARAAVLPSDQSLRGTTVPDVIDVPFELLDAAAEAVRSGRGDLVPVLAARHSGAAVDADGRTGRRRRRRLGLLRPCRETRGRLRALVAHVGDSAPSVVGVVSWLLLSDGWHALETQSGGGSDTPLVRVRAVEASDLAGALAPVIAEVTA